MAFLSEFHELEDLGGGQKRLTVHLREAAYAAGGGWQPIVNDWVDGDEVNPHIISAAPLRVQADGAGRRNLYPVPGDDSAYISIARPWAIISGSWQPAPMNPLVRQGNQLISQNPNWDLVLTHGGHVGKLEIFLKNGFVPVNGRFGFPASLVGLSRVGGTIRYNGQVVMRLRPPVVYDAANPEDTRPIAWSFTNFGGQSGVLFTLPSLAGMAAPVVDPTLTLQPNGAGIDTYVNSGSPDDNQGANGVFSIDRVGNILRALLKFDMSALPPGATVGDATLTLTQSNNQPNEIVVEVARILAANAAWTEAATWNFADPATSARWAGDAAGDGGADAGCTQATDYSSTPLATFTHLSTDGVGTEYNIALNLAEFNAMVAANHGMVIHATTNNVALSFRSSDATTASVRPKLVIVYTVSLAAGTGAFVLTGQATGLRAARKLTAATGAFSLTGQDAGLTVGTGPQAYTLEAAAGEFALVGQAALLKAGRKLAAASGAFALAGQAAGLRAGRKLAGTAGEFTLAGQAAGLALARRLAAGSGVFAWSGQAAGLRAARRLATLAGTFALTGQAASLNYSNAPAAADGRLYIVPVERRQYEVAAETRQFAAKAA
jgi:hypothetical protein